MALEDAALAANIPVAVLKGLESGAREPSFETIFRLIYKVKPPMFTSKNRQGNLRLF
jgi:hypothetical protein